MTRTELINFANRVNLTRLPWARREERIFSCKAWIVKWDFTDFALIKSYSTIVGIFRYSTRTMYVFDFYSHTTQQHIRKASRLLEAIEIRYLYQRSDNVIVYLPHSGNNLAKRTPKERKYIIEYDWTMYIEGDWNY